MSDDQPLNCALPITSSDTIQLAHGSGGRMSRELTESVFYPAFSNPALDARHDSAILQLEQSRIAVTTDGYVVKPLQFPGGDIGRLAIFGTVNDLAMSGARPHSLTAGFILEEGLPRQTLCTVVTSMQRAALEAGVQIASGDTKVVDRGSADQLFITTSGIGIITETAELAPSRVSSGDAVIISGDVGRHGIAVMSVREGLEFEQAPASDCAPLNSLVASMLNSTPDIHCLRDLTRGGLAAAVNEIAMDAGVGIELQESQIPVTAPVRGACELLGLDPLHVACEGRLVAFVAESQASRLLQCMRAHPLGRDSAIIGRATRKHPATVTLKGILGGTRILELPGGEQLPRIC